MTAPTPEFWRTVTDVYRDNIAHAFILTGNVLDYQPSGDGYQRLESFVYARLARAFDLIIAIDPAHGATFPIPAHRDLALRILNVQPGQPGVLAALFAAQATQRPPVTREVLVAMLAALDTLLTTPFTVERGGENRPGRVAVIFSYGDLLFPDGDLRSDAPILARLLRWAQSPAIGEARHVLLMIAESYLTVHSELRRSSSRWERVVIPMPSVAQRHAFLRFLCATYPDVRFGDGVTIDGIATHTGALTLLQIEDLVFRALGAGHLDYQMVAERKHAMLSAEFADVLHVQPARFGWERVGGYDYLKAFLTQRVVEPWRAGRLTMGGLLLSGPPGTGKTQLAEALAGACGVPFVLFSPAKILGQYVGNSERNLERAIQAMASLAPCLVFIDEIDQITGRSEHGSGVDSRVFARLLTFLEDPDRRGNVLVVAATNRPDLLDPALRSRFDRTAPVLPPVLDDRLAMARTLAAAAGMTVREETLHEVALATEGWVGRHMRDLMHVAAEYRADGLPDDEAVRMALTVYRPHLRDVTTMTQAALAELSDLRLVPPAYRSLAIGNGDAPPEPLPASHRRRRQEGGGL